MDDMNRPFGVPEAMDFSLEDCAFYHELKKRLHSLAAQPLPLEDDELEFLNAAGDASASSGKSAFDPMKPRRKRGDQ